MPSMCLHLLISRKPIPLHEIPLKILANIASIHGQHVTHSKPKAKRAYTNFEGPFFPGFFGRERSQIFGPKREKGESCQTTQHTTDSNRICHNLSIFARFCQSLTCCGVAAGPSHVTGPRKTHGSDLFQSRSFGSCSLSSP